MVTPQQKKRRYQRIADKLYQEIGREVYTHCLICPKPMSCLHHYYPKSTCSVLRYDIQNGIPLCAGHHLQHHCGNPEIHNTINAMMGEEWLEELKAKKRNHSVKTTLEYYKNTIRLLQITTKVK